MTKPDENEMDKELDNSPPQEELKKELEEQLKEQKDKYLRSLADMENTRRRMQKERQDMTKFAIDNVLCDFLDPLDNFEKALGFAETMSDEVKNWAIGFQMIMTQLKNILDQHGAKPFESKGKQFDPHLHEAVEVEETTKLKDGYIIEEFVRGYVSGERTLRPAKVKVAKAPAPKPKETDTEDNNLEKTESSKSEES